MNKWIAEFELEDGDTMPEHMDLEYKGAKLDFHCRPMWIPCSEIAQRNQYDMDKLAIETVSSAQTETCEGCKHLGKWENEVEYGYPSPCTRCKRRVEDHYER